jgi:hypothetical protein
LVLGQSFLAAESGDGFLEDGDGGVVVFGGGRGGGGNEEKEES